MPDRPNLTDVAAAAGVSRSNRATCARASEGTLRATKNLCIGSLIEAVRDHTKIVGLKQVNAVLMQPTGVITHATNPTNPSSPPTRKMENSPNRKLLT